MLQDARLYTNLPDTHAPVQQPGPLHSSPESCLVWQSRWWSILCLLSAEKQTLTAWGIWHANPHPASGAPTAGAWKRQREGRTFGASFLGPSTMRWNIKQDLMAPQPTLACKGHFHRLGLRYANSKTPQNVVHKGSPQLHSTQAVGFISNLNQPSGPRRAFLNDAQKRLQSQRMAQLFWGPRFAHYIYSAKGSAMARETSYTHACIVGEKTITSSSWCGEVLPPVLARRI